MVNRKCPVCEYNYATTISHIEMKIPTDYHLPDNYDIVVCQNCGMVYADTSASMEDYDWYYTNCNFYGDDIKDDNRERYNWIEEFLDKYLSKNSKILEFGAGNGRFSVALKNHGYRCISATDPSLESVSRLKAVKINAYVANIYDSVSCVEKNKYDAIFLFEVAEHLLVPRTAVKNIISRLKQNGYFMISVPDYSMIENSKAGIPNYFNLEHINYFSKASLDTLMAEFGLKSIDEKWVGEDLIKVYKKTGENYFIKKDENTQIAVSNYIKKQQERLIENNAKIEYLLYQKQDLIIWGTGSLVMSLFATTSLKKCHIIAFVDNNRIKHGRKILGYPIYSPEYIKDKKCTIVICSMLYAENIKKQIENMHIDNEIVIL